MQRRRRSFLGQIEMKTQILQHMRIMSALGQHRRRRSHMCEFLHETSFSLVDVLGDCKALSEIEYWVFYDLPAPTSVNWTQRFLGEIPVGVDLQPTIDLFLATLLGESDYGLSVKTVGNGGPVAEQMARLFKRRLEGNVPGQDEWICARRAADTLLVPQCWSYDHTAALSNAIWHAGVYGAESQKPDALPDDLAASAYWIMEAANNTVRSTMPSHINQVHAWWADVLIRCIAMATK